MWKSHPGGQSGVVCNVVLTHNSVVVVLSLIHISQGIVR